MSEAEIAEWVQPLVIPRSRALTTDVDDWVYTQEICGEWRAIELICQELKDFPTGCLNCWETVKEGRRVTPDYIQGEVITFIFSKPRIFFGIPIFRSVIITYKWSVTLKCHSKKHKKLKYIIMWKKEVNDLYCFIISLSPSPQAWSEWLSCYINLTTNQ